MIPAEVIALYLTLDGILKSAPDGTPVQTCLWIIFVVLLIGTPLYLLRVAQVTKWQQVFVSTLAFLVWVFSLGGPFEAFDWYHRIYGALVLPLFTFFVPLVVLRK